MMAYVSLLKALIARDDLTAEDMAASIGAMMDREWSAVRSAAFLIALASKGETLNEVVGAARAMRARSLPLEHALDVVVDTCGTGGDGAHTINVSTATAFALAGCGVHVAKHGNRAASSACGSADVLEACGVALDESAAVARLRLERDRFAFLFAQHYHPAMRAVGPVRRELAVPTIFNLLGPLANPARATHQVIGVARRSQLELVGNALFELGAAGGAIVHARSGIDEVAGDVPTDVYQFARTGISRWTLDPADYGVRAEAASLRGGTPQQNAAALRDILMGERSPRAEIVALNAALVLVVAERAADLHEGLALARASLRDGAAYAVFERLQNPASLEYA